MLKKEIEELKEFIFINKKVIILSLVFLIVAFGYATTIFTLGLNSEMAVFNEISSTSEWIAQKNFSIGILKKIFSTNEILPFRNTFLAVIMIFIVSLYSCKIFNKVSRKKENNISNIIFTILFITMPISVYYLYYSTFSFEFGIGMLLCILAVDFFNKGTYIYKDFKYLIPGICFLILGIGVCQSFVPFYILVQSICFFIYFIEKNNKIKDKISVIVKSIIYLIISLVVYLIISNILCVFVQDKVNVSNFFVWNKVGIREIMTYFKSIFLNNDIYGGLIIRPTICIGLILTLYYVLIKKKPIEGLILLFIMLTPMIIPLILRRTIPYSMQQTIIFMIPAIWYLLSYTINIEKIRKVLFIFVILVAIRQTLYINKLFYSDYLRYQNDLNLSRKISNRIYNLNISDVENYPVVYVGKKETDQIPNLIKEDMIGYSVYEIENGNYNRMQQFMTLTTSQFKLATQEDFEKAKELAKDMPSWPNKDSVALKNNLIIVKLSGY